MGPERSPSIVSTASHMLRIFRASSIEQIILLLRLSRTEYLYIGDRVFAFDMSAPLAKFAITTTGTGWPQSYARDTEGKYYLLEARKILDHRPEFIHTNAPHKIHGYLVIDEWNVAALCRGVTDQPSQNASTEPIVCGGGTPIKQRLDALYREVAADVATNIAGTPLLFVTNIRHVLPTQTLLGSASFIGDLEDPYVYYDRVKHSAPNVGIHMLPIREVHP